MSEQGFSTAPQSVVQGAQTASETHNSDLSHLPPKQRFTQSQKRRANADAQGSEVAPQQGFTLPDPSISIQQRSPSAPRTQHQTEPEHQEPDFVDSDDEPLPYYQAHNSKRLNIEPSKIRGLAPPRKPRIGPEFQAAIPDLLPR